VIRLGTRRSRLALAQAQLVADALGGVEIVPMTTVGDRDPAARFEQIEGGRGIFTRDIERALLDGEIDVAVHSAKDLTADAPPGLTIGAITEREDPRDVVCGRYASLAEIPAEARVGTSSARRSGLLAELRPDLEIVPLRGNVDTRLRKLDDGEADAIVLAAAGLRRLGLERRAAFALDPLTFIPEAGQGCLAIQVRAGEEEVVGALDHAPSRARWAAERARVEELGGGCTVPVAAYAWFEDGELCLTSWSGR
jgi:hydroxymethylbilane synthase